MIKYSIDDSSRLVLNIAEKITGDYEKDQNFLLWRWRGIKIVKNYSE